MNIAVVGHLCLDVIHLPRESDVSDGRRTYGGIFFTIATLANLLGVDDRIVPVLGVGKADYSRFLERLSLYRNVDASAIFSFGGPTNEVHLYYQDEQQRTECSEHISEPIPLKRIRPHLDADMVLVNMISGFDITLETLDGIRMAVRDRRAPVYFDVHSLSLGIGENSTRIRRPLREWRRWLFWLHAVQMNEEECAGLTDERLGEEDLAQQITALNTAALFVTRASRGCTAYMDHRKQVVRHDIPGVTNERIVDPTGCGDVFGAAYCAKYLDTQDILESARFANTVATHKALMADSGDIDQLRRFRVGEGLKTRSGVME